jgi:hypothetical protein
LVLLFTSLIVALSLAAPTPEPAQAVAPLPAEPGSIALDVPYLPQTEMMCGGAAAAMVFRYWGDAHAGVRQFDALVDRRAGGIATDALVRAVEQRQWRTLRPAASIEALRNELRARRPVIVLVQDRPNRYHYVVVIGADAGGVMVHDPAWGPSRRIAAADLLHRWQAAGFWSLVILPPDLSRAVRLQADQGEARLKPDTTERPDQVRLKPDATEPEQVRLESDATERAGSCDYLMTAAIEDVQRRGLADADAIFSDVRSRCPDSAGPLRELAGVRFAQRRWPEAAALAERAVALDAHDEYAWDVLGASRFMQDDAAGALRAWNRIGKPTIDAVQIEGLSRTRYALVADTLALPAGSVLTEPMFRRAERRLSELPGYVDTRLGVRPQRDGFAAVNAAVVERPARPRGPIEWAASLARAAIDREVSVTLPGSTGQGEQWNASWRWWTGFPRVAVSFATPHRGALPGVWRVEGSWETQTFGFETRAGRGRPVVPVSEDRAHGGLSISDWFTADLRYELNAGIDVWNGDRRTVSVGGSLERRLAGDRVSIAGNVAAWVPFAGGDAFQAAGLRTGWRSSVATTGTVYLAGAGAEAVSAAAPLVLWPGAGDGHARAPLLRAHPLAGRVISGPAFGERLAYANAELQRWIGPPASLPVRFAIAGFVDVARAARRAPSASGDPFQVDAGIGLRVKVPGQKGALRVDVGRGVRDAAHAITLGWQF